MPREIVQTALDAFGRLDVVISNAGIIDYGSVRQFGLRHDQYRYDQLFDWVCSPNDTHACRIRSYVRNGIVTRLGSTYDYQKYADLYGNKATANWNPRQCAKG